MEQARITSHQGNQGTQAARGKSQAQGKDSLADAQGGAAAGGFMALLAALGDGGAQDMLALQSTVEGALSIELVTTDVATQTVLSGGLLSWQWSTAIGGGGAVQGGTGQEITAAPGSGVVRQGLAQQGLRAAQVSDPVADQGPLEGEVASLISSDESLRESGLHLQEVRQDVGVAVDGREMAADMQGAAGKTNLVTTDVATQTVLSGGLLSWQWSTAIGGGAVQGGTGQEITAAPGPGVVRQGLAQQGLRAAQVADPVAGQGPLEGEVASLIPSDESLRESGLHLQEVRQDVGVAVDGREMAADMQGAAGKRKIIGRLGLGATPASDVVLKVGVQSTGQVGAKGQSVSLIQEVPFQPLVVQRRDVEGRVKEGYRPIDPGIDGVSVALAQWASDATVGMRGVVRGAELGASVSGAGGTAELIQDLCPVGLAGEGGSESVDPAMLGAEDAVAEQVAYWVHQNIQNARLTVKHDGQPVEVSVSLAGNEAHVTFGSDEAQTRELLDGSVAQLRDMLRQEGLVLSGVSVGESGRRSGDESAGSGNSKSAPKQAQVVVPSAGESVAGSASVQSDRAVDIFV